MRNMFITIRSGLPVVLEDGSKSVTRRTERTCVRKISSNLFSWKDAAGRICKTEAKVLFPPSFGHHGPFAPVNQ